MKIQLLNQHLYTDLDIQELDSRLASETIEARTEMFCLNYCGPFGDLCKPICDQYW